MLRRVHRLADEDVLDITLDARVVAIRWDVIPWGLVLDLDAPLSEDDKTSMRRAWLCFPGLSSFTWVFMGTRLPTGCWLTSPVWVLSLANGFSEYHFSALVPQFHADGTIKENVSTEVIVRSRGIAGVVSELFAQRGDFGLVWGDRIKLATDQEFIDILSDL